MKNILGEAKDRVEYNPIQVKLTDFEYASCDECKVVFEPDDIILSYSVNSCHKHYACPLHKPKFWFGSRQCRNRVYGGSKSYYENNYILD